MPHGGFRPNAGAKKGSKHKKTLEKEALRKVVYNFVAENMEPILQGLLERAQGVQVQKIDASGHEKVYDLPPDPQAAKILIEHAVGKPQESLDLTSGGKAFVQPTNEQLARFLKRHGN